MKRFVVMTMNLQKQEVIASAVCDLPSLQDCFQRDEIPTRIMQSVAHTWKDDKQSILYLTSITRII